MREKESVCVCVCVCSSSTVGVKETAGICELFGINEGGRGIADSDGEAGSLWGLLHIHQFYLPKNTHSRATYCRSDPDLSVHKSHVLLRHFI